MKPSIPPTHLWFQRPFRAAWARLVAHEAHKKAQRAAMTRRQKIAKIGLFAGMVVIFLLGYLASALITAGVVALFLHDIVWRKIHQRPWTVPAMVRSLAFPIAPFVLIGAVSGHMATRNAAEAAHTDALMMSTQPAAISQDVSGFQQDFENGTLRVMATEAVGPLARSERDPLGNALLRAGFWAGVAGRANPTDMNAAFPLVDLWVGRQILMIYSDTATQGIAQRRDAAIAAVLGKPTDAASAAEIAAAHETAPSLPGILMVGCVLDHSGRVLSATAFPTGRGLDARTVPALSPLVDICQSFGAPNTAPKHIVMGSDVPANPAIH